jgi:hypothetical protein
MLYVIVTVDVCGSRSGGVLTPYMDRCAQLGMKFHFDLKQVLSPLLYIH